MIGLAAEPDRWVLGWARIAARWRPPFLGVFATDGAYWSGYWLGVTWRARGLGISVSELLLRRRSGLDDDETGKNK